MGLTAMAQKMNEDENLPYSVVGWYHSHPSASTNPSVEDVKILSSLQSILETETRGFVGVITSPSHCPDTGETSEFTYYHIQDNGREGRKKISSDRLLMHYRTSFLF